MSYVFEPAPQTSVGVHGVEQRFPVHRIYCVGRNYAAHAREMGNDEKDPPFFFCKPADALVENNSHIAFPKATSDLHFEMELVVAIGKDGADIKASDATAHIYGYACGIDLTRRDLQAVAKAARRPWEMGKAFDQSAPIAPIHRVSDLGHHLPEARIWLDQNGETKQDGNLKEQIWQVPEMIEHLSALVDLAAGDLIMTGTPAGVGQTVKGDTLIGRIEGLTPVSVTFA